MIFNQQIALRSAGGGGGDEGAGFNSVNGLMSP